MKCTLPSGKPDGGGALCFCLSFRHIKKAKKNSIPKRRHRPEAVECVEWEPAQWYRSLGRGGARTPPQRMLPGSEGEEGSETRGMDWKFSKEMEEKKDDIENYCFICGINRHILDKKTEERRGFAYHINFEHNLWNYIFYIMYLKHKEKTEYSGFESYVADKLEFNDITWFPLNKALSLGEKSLDFEEEFQEEEENEENTQEQELIDNELVTKLELMEKEIDSFEAILEKSLKAHKYQN